MEGIKKCRSESDGGRGNGEEGKRSVVSGTKVLEGFVRCSGTETDRKKKIGNHLGLRAEDAKQPLLPALG